MTEVQARKLAHANLNLVYKYVAKNKDKQFSPEELIGPAYIGLRRAADNYHSKRKVDFEQFAWGYMGFHIWQFKRWNYNCGLTCIPNRGRDLARFYDINLEEMPSDEPNILEIPAVTINSIEDALKPLPRWDRHILRLYYCDDFSMQQIADIYGAGRTTVFQWVKKALHLLELHIKYPISG